MSHHTPSASTVQEVPIASGRHPNRTQQAVTTRVVRVVRQCTTNQWATW